MKHWEIWMEGFAATGQSQGAQLLNNGENGVGLIPADSFDEAVIKYMQLVPDSGIRPNIQENYVSMEAFRDRESNWNIWRCNLYPTEEQARKHFG